METLFWMLNGAIFLLFAYDKRQAIHHRWRVPERTLLMGCLLGGAIGGYAAMLLCRHKVRKWKFKLGVPLILLLHAMLWLSLR